MGFWMTVLAVFVGALLAGWALTGVLGTLTHLNAINVGADKMRGWKYCVTLAYFVLVGVVGGPFVLAELIAEKERRDEAEYRALWKFFEGI